jgi:hypothetical protein
MAGLLGIYYSVSDNNSAPRNGYFGEGFNFYFYQSPTASSKYVTVGYNITVDREPITNAENPYGLYLNEQNTYYAIFRPAYSFCSGRGTVNGTKLLKYLNTIVCVGRGTRILMESGEYLPIEQIGRGQEIIGHDGRIHRVAEVNKQIVANSALIDVMEFQPYCLDGQYPLNRLIITHNHPIFYKGARRPAKCFKMLPNVREHRAVKPETILPQEPICSSAKTGSNEKTYTGHYVLYDLQFEEDGSYIAEGLAIQSRSPWSELTPLARESYFDQTKYVDKTHWDSFDQSLPLDEIEILP